MRTWVRSSSLNMNDYLNRIYSLNIRESIGIEVSVPYAI